jgi:hypothetical protein
MLPLSIGPCNSTDSLYHNATTITTATVIALQTEVTND